MLDRVIAWWRRPRYAIDRLDPTSDQSLVMRALVKDFLDDRRAERRSRVLKAFVYFLMFALPTALYAWFGLYAGGFRVGPGTEVVGVVRLEGEMVPGTLAAAERVNGALDAAFESPRVKAIVLAIDSPGGAPVEAERIYRAIELHRKTHAKPVVAVISNIGASAAYMVALHADKIYAAQYSLVGSVGAKIAAWDVHKALARLDIAQRVYTSGKLKAMLDPFLPLTPEADNKAKELVEQMGHQFRAELDAARAGKLMAGIDYSSGGVWGGKDAHRLGLVDEIGTLDEIVKKTWGLPIHDFGPRESAVPFIATVGEWVKGTVANALGGPMLR